VTYCSAELFLTTIEKMKTTLHSASLAPDFALADQNGKIHTLSAYRGQWVVLYAYPRDLTPGCTLEAIDFSALLPQFEAAGVQVFGISPDTVAKHRTFCDKKELQHTLLADPDHQIIEAYGAWQMKKFMGREGMGVIRSTWLIDPQGTIQSTWAPVKVKDHAQIVLDTVRAAQKAHD
jgi:thioredoxin-dependent peroxiredoxin